MIQINSLVFAVIAIIAIIPTNGAPVQTTTQAEVSWFLQYFIKKMMSILVFFLLLTKIKSHRIRLNPKKNEIVICIKFNMITVQRIRHPNTVEHSNLKSLRINLFISMRHQALYYNKNWIRNCSVNIPWTT